MKLHQSTLISPEHLVKHHKYAKAQLGNQYNTNKPIFLVMHGESGSTDEEIQSSVKAGVIKMNVDTNIQWAYRDGVCKFITETRLSPRGEWQPSGKGGAQLNKNYYDLHVWTLQSDDKMVYLT